MRDTVLCLVDDVDRNAVRQAVETMVADVAAYVPGYRLKQAVQVTRLADHDPLHTLRADLPATARWKISVFLEVAGAGHYLPPYAGNLDIMTSAALRVGERLAARRPAEVAP
jgi:acetaldehyde dehydrogenase